MGMQLHACLINGLPNLEIIDSDTQQVILNWSYDSESVLTDKKQLQDLFRELLLLTLRQGNSNPRQFSLQGITMPVVKG